MMDKSEIVAAYMDRTPVWGRPIGMGETEVAHGEITVIDSGDSTVKIGGRWCRWATLSTDPSMFSKPYNCDPRVVASAARTVEVVRENCPRVRLTGEGFTDVGKSSEAYMLGVQGKVDPSKPGTLAALVIDEDGMYLVNFPEEDGDGHNSFEFVEE